MQRKAIQRFTGILLIVFSLTLLPSILLAWINDEESLTGFALSLLVTAGSGLVLWWPVRNYARELQVRDGFGIVAIFWLALGLYGGIPFLFNPGVPLVDAFFETVSGLTSTGSTVFIGLDKLPLSTLYYRAQLEWVGGIGVVVLAIAVLPMLGIGGMQLYRAETPGPMKDSKLTPRITETAKALWYVYLGLTVACAGGYWLAGMDVFDAICHAYATVSLGGFSTHDASFTYFNNVWIDVVCMVFMVLAGVNFAVHFLAWRGLSLKPYKNDPEFLTYILILSVAGLLVVLGLYLHGVYPTWGDAARFGLFNFISVATTTGFVSADFPSWPAFVPALMFMTSFIGACAGSTGGGLKVIRVLMLVRQGMREVRRLIHPNAQFPVKIGGVPLTSRVISAVWGFFALYIASYGLLSLAVAATGLDYVTAFSAVAACLNNAGVGLGAVSANFAGLSDTAKWILSFAMLLGRLEIFTVLVLLMPEYWRH
ncbi:MAG: potassium transporter [Gammaproteobacteria bacterium]|nr:potassium transporter [Gammaproteobacteria bacterium]